MGILKEIEILVWEKYPRTQAERKCAIERRMMDRVRDNYRQRLINERIRETQILATIHPATKDN